MKTFCEIANSPAFSGVTYESQEGRETKIQVFNSGMTYRQWLLAEVLKGIVSNNSDYISIDEMMDDAFVITNLAISRLIAVTPYVNSEGNTVIPNT